MENYDAIDAMAYSVMSYSSFAGDGHNGYTNGTWDYAQSPMIRDIAAVQYMYGANFQTRSSDTIYSWSAVTGEKFINGVGQGAPGGNKVFETIWDGGGRDTINLSNYSSDLTIDLSPGGWIDFNNSQVANLGKGNFAPGNVAMSLLYEGDMRSLIENAVGGSGNDTIVGNFGGNVLIGGAGNDYVEAIDGHSILAGGTIGGELSLLGVDRSAYISVVPTINGFDGNDTLIGGNGNDIFVVATGSDTIDGYIGIDTLVIDTVSANVKLVGTAGSFTIAYGTAIITASNIDFLATKDGIFAISGSDAGIVSPRLVEIQKNISLVYNAGLDRAIDASGLTYWSNMLSNGGSLRELASGIINADEFAKLFGNPKSMNDTSFVQVLYKNVLDREGEAGGLNYWVGTLASGANTRADVLVGFSLSEENRAALGNNIPKMQVDGSGNPVELVAVTQTQWHDLWA
jgi:serralysin